MRKTAFEELSEWCEKHMPIGTYEIIEESNSYNTTIYLNLYEDEIPYMAFSREGNFVYSGALSDEDRLEHIRDLEATERERGEMGAERIEEAPKSDPVPTTVGALMVRKMIESYERQAH